MKELLKDLGMAIIYLLIGVPFCGLLFYLIEMVTAF